MDELRDAGSAAGDTSTGLTPALAAGIACVGGFLTGVVFLVLEKRNAYVRFWAMQSTLFSGFWLLIAIVLTAVTAILAAMPLIGVLFALVMWLVFALLYLAGLLIWIWMLVQSFNGREWRMPFFGRMAEEQLKRLPRG